MDVFCFWNIDRQGRRHTVLVTQHRRSSERVGLRYGYDTLLPVYKPFTLLLNSHLFSVILRYKKS